MEQLRGQDTGFLPKPPNLLKLFKYWLKGKISYDDLLPHVRRHSSSMIRSLEETGLDYIWDGCMHRWERYHYAIMHIKNVDVIGRIPVYDDNYVFKAVINEELIPNKNYYLNEVEFISKVAKKPVKIPILGPYTLANWSFGSYYIRKWRERCASLRLARYYARREMVANLTRRIIIPILREIVTKYNNLVVQIDEPSIFSYLDELDIVVENVNEIVRKVNPNKVILNICHGSYEDLEVIFQYVCEMKIDQIMFGLAQFDSWNLGTAKGDRKGYYEPLKILLEEYGYDREVGLGVINPYTSLIEPPSLVRDRIIFALNYINPSKLLVNPDCDLISLSLDVAFKKLSSMIEGVKLAEKFIGGES